MAGFNYWDSYNPFRNNPNFDTNINAELDRAGATGPGGTQTDWWDMLPEDANDINSYNKRVGGQLANALGGIGYYTDERSKQNLGANVRQLVNIARAKAAQSGNISGPDTVRQYLKDHLKQYLLTGSLGGATGVAGPGSTGTNYKDAYGQIAANAQAATGNAANDMGAAANWYKNNAGSILSGLESMAGLQTGGGLRSSVMDTFGNLRDRAQYNNKQFWQDAAGSTISPWGGSFAPNVQLTDPVGDERRRQEAAATEQQRQAAEAERVRLEQEAAARRQQEAAAAEQQRLAQEAEARRLQEEAARRQQPYPDPLGGQDVFSPESEVERAKRWGPIGYLPDPTVTAKMQAAGYYWDPNVKYWLKASPSGFYSYDASNPR